ncbi:LacI family DNA-binding transcriptional regulator [Aliiglaciecola lipolytica]|uniref:LacI family DNA-binding transcriptional regulator n=1 Tax=Aliiglaciecola lipolytica TaxID=477689 RepID=UPI001C09D202|nr:LacI family DNA-binding transcriptional regulator [Aliiglaciecola lipolytica]MBU2879134.1 LacI family DNA-binding transcriptional regulator [Aliiglaciecola lipolytica]
MSKVKLQDIAIKAGVSMMTVSRVMNNDPKVGAKTREKVSRIANEMQYKPNIAARHLATSKSYFIGLVCEYASSSYVNKFLVGGLRKCRTSGYHVVLDETAGDREKALDIIKNLIEVTKVDGLILLPPISNMPEVVDLLSNANVGFVRIAPDINLSASHYICMDDYQAAFDVTEQLIKSGHTRIAHIIGSPNQGVSRLRYQGYLDALRSNQKMMPPEYIEQGYFTYKSGLDAAKRLLELPNKPDAIFAANDEMAAAVVSVAHMKHLDVPQDVSIVGFDDTELATTIWPNISTVTQPIKEMAELAIDILTTSKADKTLKASNMRHVLDYRLQLRDSSKNIVKIT